MRTPLLALLFASTLAARAAAQDTPVPAEDQALPTLSARDHAALQPLLARGPIALVSFMWGEDVPSVMFALDVRAPASRVASLVGDPASYPRYLPVLHEVHVTSTHGASTSYDWTWQAAGIELRGRNQLDAFVPPAGHEDRGWRYAVRVIGGDIGHGRIAWRIVPDGASHCFVTIAMRLDVRDGNYLAREMSSGGRTISRGAALSFATMLGLATRREAERLEHAPPRTDVTDPSAPLVWPAFDPLTIYPTIGFYDLVAFDLDAHDRLRHVLAMGRMLSHHDAVNGALHDPASFGNALIPGAQARVVSTENGSMTFDWGVSMPLLGANGRMRLADVAGAHAVTIDGVSGALHAGRWRLEERTVPDGEVYAYTVGALDIADSTWLVRSLVEGSPDLAAGLTASAEVMVVRALRQRAQELQAAPPRAN